MISMSQMRRYRLCGHAKIKLLHLMQHLGKNDSIPELGQGLATDAGFESVDPNDNVRGRFFQSLKPKQSSTQARKVTYHSTIATSSALISGVPNVQIEKRSTTRATIFLSNLLRTMRSTIYKIRYLSSNFLFYPSTVAQFMIRNIEHRKPDSFIFTVISAYRQLNSPF